LLQAAVYPLKYRSRLSETFGRNIVLWNVRKQLRHVAQFIDIIYLGGKEMRTKRYMILILGIFLIFLFYSCKQSNITSPKIGAILFETGEAKSYGIRAKRGYEMALEWGRANGYKKIPDIIYGDSAADESKGVTEFKRIVDINGVNFIVGLTGSGIAKAICPLLLEKNVFVLEALDSAVELSGCSPNFFRIYPSDEIQATFLVEWAIENDRKTSAIIYIQNAWGEGMQRGVEKRYVELGGKVLVKEGVQSGITDYTSLLIKVKEHSPKVLFLLLYPTGARRWLEQAQLRKIEMSTMGGDALTGAEVAQAGAAADGLMFSAPDPGSGPEYENFVDNFKKRYGEKPDVYAIKSYDAMKLAIIAINNSQIEPKALRTYFLQMPTFKGISGDIQFTDRGDVKSAKYQRYQYKSGQASILYSEKVK
jgi:branched-chain amino acid transport system substrate-binding protein